MKQKNFKVTALVIFGILFQIVNTHYIYSQNIDLVASDSAKDHREIIDPVQVSRKSAELNLKVKVVVHQVINDGELNRIQNENNTVISFIDSLFVRESDILMNTLSIRNLKGKLIYWQQNLEKVNNQQIELSNIFTELDESIKYLDEELKFWNTTDELINRGQLRNSVQQRCKEISHTIDTTKNILNIKSAKVLNLIDLITRVEVDIESFITEIKFVISAKQENIFVTDQTPLFKLNYANKNNWILPQSYFRYYSGLFSYLVGYLGRHLNNVIFHLVFFISLIFLFKKINRQEIKGGKAVGGEYINRLKILLAKPISSALIIAVFASVIIYPYRPLFLLDITRFIVTIPLVIVLVNILQKRYHIYVYTFSLLVFLHIIFLNLPVNHIHARFALTLIALIEIASLTYFVKQFRETSLAKKDYSSYTLVLVYFLLSFAYLALLANIIGKVSFSIYMVEGLIGIVLVFILISFSLVVVNGLIVLLIDNEYVNNLNIVSHNKSRFKIMFTRFFNGIAGLAMIYFILDIFGWEAVVYDLVVSFLQNQRKIGSVDFKWGDIIIFFLLIYLSIVIGNFTREILEKDVLKKNKMKKGVPYAIGLMAKYSLVTLGIMLAVSVVGLPTDSLTVIIGAFGVGIGFGLQNIFNNLVSGLILLFERPIQLGDTIEVGTIIGNVRSIGIRSSSVRTFDGAEIIVPNGNLISDNVINWTLSDDRKRIELLVGVSYSSNPREVREILLNIIINHPEIESDPVPNVLFQELGDSSLNFRMLFWTSEYDQWIRIKSDVLFQVFDDFKVAGIEIPFPQSDLHLRSIDDNIKFTALSKDVDTQ
tara:strand:+ start:3058 stop:5526 length:2469 start_codon:yes stop_codon:yes gene_type:complete